MKEARIDLNLDLLLEELKNRGFEIHHEVVIAKDPAKHKDLIEVCEHFMFSIIQFDDSLVIENDYDESLLLII